MFRKGLDTMGKALRETGQALDRAGLEALGSDKHKELCKSHACLCCLHRHPTHPLHTPTPQGHGTVKCRRSSTSARAWPPMPLSRHRPRWWARWSCGTRSRCGTGRSSGATATA